MAGMIKNTVTPAYWEKQHELMMKNPRGAHVCALVQLYRGLHEYAAAHQRVYGSAIGDDYVLSEGFAEVCSGFLTLLNGETGLLDCGTLDGGIRELCRKNNVEGFE